MLIDLLNEVLEGKRWAKSPRSGLKLAKSRQQLIIYRHGELKLWIDLSTKEIRRWSIRTKPEAKAFNQVLKHVGCSEYRFMRSGTQTILLRSGEHYGLDSRA